MAGDARPHFVSKQALQQIFVLRQRVLREDRIPELLELIEDLVIEAGIVMVRTAQHHDADAVFALELVKHLASAAADIRLVVLQRRESRLDRPIVFLLREAEYRLPRHQHLMGE